MTLPPIIYLDYPFDKQELLACAARAKEKANTVFTRGKLRPQLRENLTVSEPYIDKIMADFGIEAYQPIFYWLNPNDILPLHTDYVCSINFVLDELDDPEPLIVDGVAHKYTNALFNPRIPHYCQNGDRERTTLAIKLTGQEYEDIAPTIKYKKLVQSW
jgi:hypothetical protein